MKFALLLVVFPIPLFLSFRPLELKNTVHVGTVFLLSFSSLPPSGGACVATHSCRRAPAPDIGSIDRCASAPITAASVVLLFSFSLFGQSRPSAKFCCSHIASLAGNRDTQIPTTVVFAATLVSPTFECLPHHLLRLFLQLRLQYQ